MSDKLSEANDCYIKADKHLKTGFLKWRPDYELAANEYSRAATCFKAVRMPDKCLDAHLKAADCYEKTKSYFSAAKCYEQSAMVCKDLNDWDSVIKYMEKSCHMFREHGVVDTAALTFNRGAQMIENQRPEKAAEWYGQASEVTMIEDRPKQATEYANKAVRIFLKLKKYDNAIDWLKKAMSYLVESEDNQALGRLYVGLILIQLAREDSVAAEKAFREGKGYIEDQEIYYINQILEGFDKMDANAIVNGLNCPFIKSLDNEYTKIARDLQQKFKANLNTNESSKSNEDLDDEAGAML
ncbi:gamma-soluble NSF attachment protein-like [Oppia nitens]|uniref:gamma-soluble NSF attachment protein-like n=1 Tax=Oppia nitens TaxID=1686743 RepID=UPI0023DAAC3F|nr:gamma-soluble NSF attachment protein-like [Oppia nitens]